MTWKDVEVNPFDPNSQDFQPETLPLDEIIRQAIFAAMMKLRVHMPGQIVNVRGNQRVDVQPLIQTRYIDGSVVTIPVIQNVMVGMPMGADYSIRLPIAVGDTGHLLFSDRSLDIWANGTGGITDPQDSRNHDLCDPVFIPGLVPFANQTKITTTDLVVTNGKAVASFQKAGTYKFSNGTNELLNILDQVLSNQISLMNVLATETFTLTLLGPQPFIAATVTLIQNLQTALQSLQSQLETLKGT